MIGDELSAQNTVISADARKARRDTVSLENTLGTEIAVFVAAFGDGAILLVAAAGKLGNMTDVPVWRARARVTAMEKASNCACFRDVCSSSATYLNMAMRNQPVGHHITPAWEAMLVSTAGQIPHGRMANDEGAEELFDLLEGTGANDDAATGTSSN